MFFIFRIYSAKNSQCIPKCQRCLSSDITSSIFLVLTKSVIWFFHDCCGLPLLLLWVSGSKSSSANDYHHYLKIKIHNPMILPVVLYDCETWSLSLREECKLRVFENRILRRIFGPRGGLEWGVEKAQQ